MILSSEFSVLRTARWRSDPATDPQKKFVSSKWKNMQNMTKEDMEKRIKSLTKGDAANIITRLKHGAQVSNLKFA